MTESAPRHNEPQIIRTIAELRAAIAAFRRAGADSGVGFVPTMGYLHEGHASLIRKSAADNGLTLLSIFVNPIQFGPNEDLDKYPRDEARDLKVAAASGASIVFLPSAAEMYPAKRVTTVTVNEVSDSLCGASRPGHFDGVATVVAKLFNIVQPDRAYFGMKDAQQVAVIARMVQDLNIPVEVVPCPILREEDGLALSSRNVYLDAKARSEASVLSRALSRTEEWIEEGATASELISRLSREIASSDIADIDYVDLLTYPELTRPEEGKPLAGLDADVLVAVAVRFGQTRLIDNKLLNPAKAGAILCSAK
ncbi:pantoate--beta-alanine ligase [Cohnella suwonensis]|uniref:Pantothenate synthetase n=1 Tax=Cohnella suwonensis TaxID=696072 RepID=A0ABW0LRV6_9BACL